MEYWSDGVLEGCLIADPSYSITPLLITLAASRLQLMFHL